MFSDLLKKYKNAGTFSFRPSESLNDKCNAPSDKAGVYLIYKVTEDAEVLVYIGASGLRGKDGTLKVRKDGLKGRLVNGYHPHRFGEKERLRRCVAFPRHMKAVNIAELKIYWWVTHDGVHTDFPTDIEEVLRRKYIEKFGRLPEWHK